VKDLFEDDLEFESSCSRPVIDLEVDYCMLVSFPS